MPKLAKRSRHSDVSGGHYIGVIDGYTPRRI